jgi:hypothetical protein
MILEELLDNANDVIFQKYQMVWSTDKYGLWIECELKNPRCKLCWIELLKRSKFRGRNTTLFLLCEKFDSKNVKYF